jgi:hypothetical protein
MIPVVVSLVSLCDLSIPNGCMFSKNQVVRFHAGIDIFLPLHVQKSTLQNSYILRKGESEIRSIESSSDSA